MFNPITASQKIKREFVDYLSTDFRFRNKSLQSEYIHQLNENITKDLFLEINNIYKTGESMADLINDGVLSKRFFDLEKGSRKPILPLTRPLYTHQVEAIEQIVSGNNVVVSTGTGSGKTNCFLIPVINELLCEIDKNGSVGPGIRALLVFPMNALANDQIKNIRYLLSNYPSITFGVYNGATPDGKKEAHDSYFAQHRNDEDATLRNPLPNELLSRDEMKETPPNILFTNYAMLEHLLFRPDDDVLFSNGDFKFVVLDEAHIYSGATGIEIAMLLRKLKARIRRTDKTQFILTSATLGGTKHDIIDFAKKISGEEFYETNIIGGQRETQFLTKEKSIEWDAQIFNELADEKNNVRDIMDKYHVEYDSACADDEQALLYDFIYNSKQYYRLRVKEDNDENIISQRNGVFALRDLEKVVGLDSNSLVSFISLCTRARKDNRALIDARYHYFIRTLEGCYISLDENDQTLSLVPREWSDGKRLFEVALCDDCGSVALVGRTKSGYLRNTKKHENRTEEFEYYYIADLINDDIEDEDDEEADENKNPTNKGKKPAKPKEFYLCPHCGRIVPKENYTSRICDCKNVTPIHLIKARKTDSGDAKCFNCHTGTHKRLFIGNDGATSTLATSLFEALPETEYRVVEEKENHESSIFDIVVSEPEKKEFVHKGQFLAFSDSRQQAAKFACYLQTSYQEFLRRRGIYHLVKEHREHPADNSVRNISHYVQKLYNYFANKNCFADTLDGMIKDQSINERYAWLAMLNELARGSSGNSLTSLGFIQFRYHGNRTPTVINWASKISDMYKERGVTQKDVLDLLDLLIMEIVRVGAVITDNQTDISPEDREYIFYSQYQKYISLHETNRTSISMWLPKTKGTNDNGQVIYTKTKKLYYVKKALHLNDGEDEKAVELLNSYFEYLTNKNNPDHMEDPEGKGWYVLKASSFDVLFEGDEEASWYKCKTCGKVHTHLLSGRCAVPRCGGEAVKVNPVDLYKDNHFADLYQIEKMQPIIAREHTAQLNHKESTQYQKDFIDKKINVLSCSTTFEMGVDIGDLEAVFLRDIPPSPANYNQRAGRAGRSADAAAFVLSFAKLSSHDFYYYDNPMDMISGQIAPPYFELDNTKIANRHIYSIAFSYFFRDGYKQIYNGNNANYFLNEHEGYVRGYELFCNWLEKQKVKGELQKLLKESIPDDNDFHERLGINDNSWIDKFIGTDGVLSSLIATYDNNVEQFKEMIEELRKKVANGDTDSAKRLDMWSDNLKRYQANQLIDFLARGNVLPRYGFPVDTVELDQYITSGHDELNLSRDLQMAISEYAPSSEVIADGNLYTSRYIKKSVQDQQYGWRKNYIGVCENCHEVVYSVLPPREEIDGDHSIKCPACGAVVPPDRFKVSIEPVAGFVCDEVVKDVPLVRQERSSNAPVFYIGDGKPVDKPIEFRINNLRVQIESTKDDSLLVRSKDPFYVCERCGYAVSDDQENPFGAGTTNEIRTAMKYQAESIDVDRHNFTHKNTKGELCGCNHYDRYYLHHTFRTDVMRISFPDCYTEDQNTMLSAMYAIYNAIIRLYQIEQKDLSVCLSKKVLDNGLTEYRMIFYDTIAGGSGYCRRLALAGESMFKHIIEVAYDNMDCDCDPSCYKCLRSYENRAYHDDLDHKKARNWLEQFII